MLKKIFAGEFKALNIVELFLLIIVGGILLSVFILNLQQMRREKTLVQRFLKTDEVLTVAYKNAEAVNSVKIDKVDTADIVKDRLESQLRLSNNENCGYDTCLADGTGINYEKDTFSAGCVYKAGNTSSLQNACLSLIVDVNGEKAPNVNGKDVYRFWITRYELIPDGSREECSDDKEFLDCGAYVKTNKKLYKITNTYNTEPRDTYLLYD